MDLTPLDKGYIDTELEYNGRSIVIFWDGTNLVFAANPNSRRAVVTELNDYSSGFGSGSIRFEEAIE